MPELSQMSEGSIGQRPSKTSTALEIGKVVGKEVLKAGIRVGKTVLREFIRPDFPQIAGRMARAEERRSQYREKYNPTTGEEWAAIERAAARAVKAEQSVHRPIAKPLEAKTQQAERQRQQGITTVRAQLSKET